MLPTSRPANYSNSEDFRLTGRRRQILTKNIKRSLAAVASDGQRLVRFTAEARISTSRILRFTYRGESPADKRSPVATASEYAFEIPTGPETSGPACPPAYRFPYYRGIRDTCGATLARRDAVRCDRNRVCTLHTIGERDTGVNSWECSRMWFDRSAMDVLSASSSTAHRHGRFAFGRHGLIARRSTLFS